MLLKKNKNLTSAFLEKRLVFQSVQGDEKPLEIQPSPQKKEVPALPLSPAAKSLDQTYQNRVTLAGSLPPRPDVVAAIKPQDVKAAPETPKADVIPTVPSVVKPPESPAVNAANVPKLTPTPGSGWISYNPSSNPTNPGQKSPVAKQEQGNLASTVSDKMNEAQGFMATAMATIGPLLEQLGPMIEQIRSYWDQFSSMLGDEGAKQRVAERQAKQGHKDKVDQTVNTAVARFKDQVNFGAIDLGLNGNYTAQEATKFICDSLGIPDQGTPDKLLAVLKNSGAVINEDRGATNLAPGDLIFFKKMNGQNYETNTIAMITEIEPEGVIKYKILPSGSSSAAPPLEMDSNSADFQSDFFCFVKLPPDRKFKAFKTQPPVVIPPAIPGVSAVPANPAGSENQSAALTNSPQFSPLKQPENSLNKPDKSKLFDLAAIDIAKLMDPKQNPQGILDYDNGWSLLNENEGATYKTLESILLAYYVAGGKEVAMRKFSEAKKLFDAKKGTLTDQLFSWDHLATDMGFGKYLNLLEILNTSDNRVKGYVSALLKIFDDTVKIPQKDQAATAYHDYLMKTLVPLNDESRFAYLKEIKLPHDFIADFNKPSTPQV